MKTRGWLALILFSLIGYSATFLIFPKVMPAARWNHNVDYMSAITIAQNAARDFGVTDMNWENIGSGLNLADVSAEYSRRRETYLAAEPNGLGQGYFTPVDVNVKLIDIKTRRRIAVVLNSNGQLLEFENSTREEQKKEEESQKKQPETVSEADTQLAQSTIKNLWGDKALASAKLSDSSVTRQGSRFVWKSEDSRMRLLAKALVSDGKIRQVSLEHEFTSQFETEFNSKRSMLNKVLSNAGGVFIWPPVFLIAVFFFIGVALKRIQHKQALIFTAIVFVLVTVFNWLQGVTVTIDEGTQPGGSYWVAKLFSWLLFMACCDYCLFPNPRARNTNFP